MADNYTIIHKGILEDPDLDTVEELAFVTYCCLHSSKIGLVPFRRDRIISGLRLSARKRRDALLDRTIEDLRSKDKLKDYVLTLNGDDRMETGWIWYKSILWYRIGFGSRFKSDDQTRVFRMLQKASYDPLLAPAFVNELVTLYQDKYGIELPNPNENPAKGGPK